MPRAVRRAVDVEPARRPEVDREQVLHLAHAGAGVGGDRLLDDRPVMGVVHVSEHVDVDATDRPRADLGAGRRAGQHEPGRHAPVAGGLAVDPVEVIVEGRGPARHGVDLDPQAHRLDDAAAIARNRRPPLGPAAPGAGAERDQPQLLAEHGWLTHVDQRASHHPREPLVELGVGGVVGGDVLEVAGDGIEAQVAAHVDVGMAHRPGRREAATGGRQGDQRRGRSDRVTRQAGHDTVRSCQPSATRDEPPPPSEYLRRGIPARNTPMPEILGWGAAGVSMNDRVLRPPSGSSAKALLLTILGEFVLPHSGSLWTSTVVRSLGAMQVEERNARQAVARLAERGIVHSTKEGRKARWHLTDHGRELLMAGTARINEFGAGDDTWDGRWLVVLCSVPEDQRAKRHQLRTQLEFAGFGFVAPGVAISPHLDREGAANRVLKDLSLVPGAIVVRAETGELVAADDLLRRAWDLDALGARYAAFLTDFSQRAPRSDGSCFAAAVDLVHSWRRFPFIDPEIPPRLLPVRWPGRRAKELFDDCRAAWAPGAHAWYAATESRTGESDTES